MSNMQYLRFMYINNNTLTFLCCKFQIQAHKKIDSRWNIPKEYYSFYKERGGIKIHFIVIDSENRGSSAQLKWFKNELKRSQGDWIIVYGHHPMLSFVHGAAASLSRSYEPAMNAAKVAFYVTGHDHHLAYFWYKDASKGVVDHVLSGGGGAGIKRKLTAKEKQLRRSGIGLLNWQEAGFAGIEIEGSKAKVTIVNKSGKVLRTFCKKNPRRPDDGSKLC